MPTSLVSMYIFVCFYTCIQKLTCLNTPLVKHFLLTSPDPLSIFFLLVLCHERITCRLYTWKEGGWRVSLGCITSQIVTATHCRLVLSYS